MARMSTQMAKTVLRRMWVDGWQLECCGDPLRVGESVDVVTTTEVDREFLGVVLGESDAAGITDYDDRHGSDLEDADRLVGTIERIEAVWCRYELRGRMMQPVADTAKVVAQHEATGHELSPEGEQREFVGYVITVRAESTAPVRRASRGTSENDAIS